MAKSKGSNFRGTTRTLYNPRTVKYLEIPTARKEYQDLRRVALKRAARLTKAGLDYLPEATPDLPQSSKLTDEQIQEELVKVSSYLRDPYTYVSQAREAYQIPEDMERIVWKNRTVLRDIPDMGDIIDKDRQRFGNFMDELRRKQKKEAEKQMRQEYGRKWKSFMDTARARAIGRLYGSDQVRTAYEEAVSRGMRPETLRKHFEKYLLDSEQAEKLASALYHAPTEGRLTIAKLKELL